MGDFFHFWLVDCFLTGATTAGGVFSIAEIICALVWLFWGRQKGEDSNKAVEDKIKKYSRWLFFFLLVFATLIYAPYAEFKKEREAKEQAQKDLNEKSAKLDGFIDQTIIGDDNANTNTLILLQTTVGNSGKSPSVADRYELKVVFTNKTSVDAEIIDIPDEYKINSLISNSALTLTLKRPELITEKTSKAIQPGESPRGWIAFKLPGIFLSRHEKSGYTIVLSFSDIYDSRIYVTNGFWKGKPAKTKHTINYPKALPGSGNLIEKPDTSTQPKNTTNTVEWLPPELPNGTTNVVVFFGNQGFIYPIDVAKISPEPSGTKILIKDLPDYMTPDLYKIPNYSPRTRDIWIRQESINQTYGPMTVSTPIFPYVTNNRLFVHLEIPYLNEKRILVMSDKFDSELSKLPMSWDRNFDPDRCVYEIVNEEKNPVLQVIYSKPNEIFVNGVFVVDTNHLLKAFGEPPQLLAFEYRAIDATTNKYEIELARTNHTALSFGNALTNLIYSIQHTNQKAIFKYPSNRYPGVFAN